MDTLSTQFGQCRQATTLLDESGYHYPVISGLSYQDRQRSLSAPFQHRGKGSRAMHATTLTIAKAPWSPESEYITTTKQCFGGSKLLNPVQRPARCRSMHRSQIRLEQKGSDSDRNTNYSVNFMEKPLIPAHVLHSASIVNRVNQTEGGKAREVLQVDPFSPTYWSQYNRIHGKLGFLLGNGISRTYPVRQQYNVITGEQDGPAWKPNNPRISGNRILNRTREDLKDCPFIM